MATKAEILQGLNDQQKDVVTNYNGKISLEAIPGSGKTFTMVSTIQYMLKDGVLPSRILAFTFTRKAANELRERVRAAVGVDADKVMICTYHSFCGRLLRGCASYVGRTSTFSIYDEDDKKKVLDESWFKRGTMLLVYGYRREDTFVAKNVKVNGYQRSVVLINGKGDGGRLDLRFSRNSQ